MDRKGIILAGGTGSRLIPSTLALSKHLLPVYDKPMIYYPISTLMCSGIREIVLVSNPKDLFGYQTLLGDGRHLGIDITYAEQATPSGIAHALIACKNFASKSPIALILGDNIFIGSQKNESVVKHVPAPNKATIFACQVESTDRYGIVELDSNGKAIHLEEKPSNARSNYAVTGLYLYDELAIPLAESLSPSYRGELEITDLNKLYLDRDALDVALLAEDTIWIDVGTHDSLLDASKIVYELERKHGKKIACLEEIALQQNWITNLDLQNLVDRYPNCEYGRYLSRLLV